MPPSSYAPHCDVPVPRVLAALRPKMLDLSRARADGAHPYLVPPAHTALARAALGPDKLLIPEQAIALESDPAEARSIGREHLSGYLRLPNYVNNLKHLGYGDDLADGGSDRLVDAIVAWGSAEDIARRIAEHRDNGADHVVLQPLGDLPSGGGAARAAWRPSSWATDGSDKGDRTPGREAHSSESQRRRCQTAAVSSEPVAQKSGVVVFCSLPGALARIRSRFPDTEVVDISGGVPGGVRGEVLFGGWGPHAVEAMAAGVQWAQLIGTGLDGVPPEVRAAPVLTSARGVAAVAISEYVIATMGAFARDFPDNWLREPPEHWFVAAGGVVGRVDARSLRLRGHRATGGTHRVGLGHVRGGHATPGSAEPH